MTAFPADSSAVPPDGVRAVFRRFVGLMLTRTGGRRLIVLLGLILAASLAEGAGLLLLVPVLRLVGVEGGGTPAIGLLVQGLGVYLLLVVAAAGLVVLRSVRAVAERGWFLDGLRTDLHRALLGVAWPEFQRLRASDVQQVLLMEVNRLGVVFDSLLALVAACLTIPVLLVAALLLSPSLTVLTLLTGAACMLVIRRIGRSGFDLGSRMGGAMRGAMADLGDDLAGFRVIRAYGAEAMRQQALERRFGELRGLQVRHARIHALEVAALAVTAALVAAVAIVAAVGWLSLPLGEALVVILGFARLAQRGLAGLRVWRHLEANLPAAVAYDGMKARLMAAAEPPSASPPRLPVLSGRLEAAGLGWQAADGRQTLAGVNFILPAGALLAVVGPSGAGKSTLADLLSGLSLPTQGEVRIDGIPVTADRLGEWRRQVAVVPQDPFLFFDSIRANLLMAAPQATEADMQQALQQAGAAEFVARLPQGLETRVGERGSSLSGGERQRLAIARALLRQPRLLVLDEATSALDDGSEGVVLETLRRLKGQMTIVAVTHREQTRAAADLVLELADGRQAAFGPGRTADQRPAS